MGTPDRRGMLDRADKGAIDPPAMHVAWHRALRRLQAATAGQRHDLALMRRLDELFTAWPFLGSRRMTAMLKTEGLQVNRKRVQRFMRKMGIAALGAKPNTTKPAPGHKIILLCCAT